MVDVVQLVRASDCGSECRGFESPPPPLKNPRSPSDCGDLSFISSLPSLSIPRKKPTFFIYNIWRLSYLLLSLRIGNKTSHGNTERDSRERTLQQGKPREVLL